MSSHLSNSYLKKALDLHFTISCQLKYKHYTMYSQNLEKINVLCQSIYHQCNKQTQDSKIIWSQGNDNSLNKNDFQYGSSCSSCIKFCPTTAAVESRKRLQPSWDLHTPESKGDALRVCINVLALLPELYFTLMQLNILILRQKCCLGAELRRLPHLILQSRLNCSSSWEINENQRKDGDRQGAD